MVRTNLLAVLLLPAALAAPSTEKRVGPKVRLSIGNVVGSSFLSVDSFMGITFAKPPVRALRLKPPQSITSDLGTISPKKNDIIFVAVNYRLRAFGFLSGKEVLADGSTNLSIRDQRLALQWVADNIASFSSGPLKVTIWGESAGSASVFSYIIYKNGNHTYKRKPLFRGAIMDSGSLLLAAAVNESRTEDRYNIIVQNASCSSFVDTYPDDVSAGSPFCTGPLKNIYPQYKTIAAITSDYMFVFTRRLVPTLAATVKPNIPTWSYISTYFYGLPVLSTFHATDLLPAFGITPGNAAFSIQSYYISFVQLRSKFWHS
ncbi:hypothetical protein V499_01080 [Pseudogymnoascus sp. VKM F-103]|nr:hypothetical protein V499_01080 [Pseudogymnoascus sp. VKM F-103]